MLSALYAKRFAGEEHPATAELLSVRGFFICLPVSIMF
jgi:hypothetical protein